MSALVHNLPLLLRVALVLIVPPYALKQVRKPDKWTGGLFLRLMNLSHSALTNWALTHLRIQSGFAILDVGCGGGRTIQKLAALATSGIVCGVDYADGSVATSRSKNSALIQAGRVEITQASVSRLPFPDNKFDLVTAVETQYYWPDLPNDMREILRVLKPGGTLAIVAETYKRGAYNFIQRPVMKLLRSTDLSADDQRQLFSASGYENIQIFEHPNGWICATGEKALPM